MWDWVRKSPSAEHYPTFPRFVNATRMRSEKQVPYSTEPFDMKAPSP